jgi:hypothetical protein
MEANRKKDFFFLSFFLSFFFTSGLQLILDTMAIILVEKLKNYPGCYTSQ